MLHRLITILIFCSTSILYGQPNASELIEEGVALNDQGKYQEAISKYDKALLADGKNLHALAEKAYSQMGMQEYKLAIATCKKALKIKVEEKEPLKLIYITYANAFDLSGKPKEAIKIYDKGLTEYPGFYSLLYNKGVTLSGMGNWDEAISCFQKSAKANPSHGSTYLALGRSLGTKKQNIPALLSYLRFHIIEPDSPRSKKNFEMIQELMFSNIEKTGDHSISITLPSQSLEEMGSAEKTEYSFRSIELILSMQSALDLGENQSELTHVDRFEKKLNSMFESLDESKKGNSGFYWEFLAPYFIQLGKNNYENVLAHLVFSNQEDDNVSGWLLENESSVRSFYEWSSNYKWD